MPSGVTNAGKAWILEVAFRAQMNGGVLVDLEGAGFPDAAVVKLFVCHFGFSGIRWLLLKTSIHEGEPLATQSQVFLYLSRASIFSSAANSCPREFKT